MGAAWAQTFHDLHPDAQQVVRACAVLDQPSLSLVSAAAVAGTDVPRMIEVLTAAPNWGSVTGDRFELVAGARAYLPELAASTPSDDVRLVLERMKAMTPADVLSLVRAGNRHGQHATAARVARAGWQGDTSDLEWCRQLADLGEEAAIASGEPDLLVELLDRSATAYAAAGDWQAAERAWLRALAVVDNRGDTARFEHFLGLLATNYRNWGRLHKTADTLLEVVALRERAGDAARTAEALAAVGTTMFDAGRLDAAVQYLERADRLLRDEPGSRTRHAVVLADLGRVHARRGAINTARTCYHRALALALEAGDDAVADRIRELQTALPPA